MIMFLTDNHQFVTLMPGDCLRFVRITDEDGPCVALELLRDGHEMPYLMVLPDCPDHPRSIENLAGHLAWHFREERDRPLVIIDVQDFA